MGASRRLCQDLSVAGKRNGLTGERSGLWFEFERIIDEMRPKWVVIENVPGLLSSARGDDFAVILRALDGFGYGVAWRVLDSQYFGVPQRRRRVFIVGSLGDLSCGQVLFEQEGVSGDIEETEESQQEDTRQSLSGTDERGNGKVAPTLPRAMGHHGWNIGNQDIGLLMTDEIREEAFIKGKNQKVINTLDSQCGGEKLATQSVINGHFLPSYWDGGQTSDTLDTSMLVKGQMMPEKRRMPAVTVWQMNHASEGYRDCGNISPTLQGRMGTGGNNVPLLGVRRLTPTECERLQGFPDGFTNNVSDGQRYKQMGNAVTVNVTEWIGKRIMKGV